MKNKPWKAWKTRKISFTVVALIWLLYAILGLFGFNFNSELLDFIFNAGVWMLGFGITLVIGVIVSMLSAIFVTKFLLKQLIGMNVKNLWLYGINKSKNKEDAINA